jgi:hypothetical protein
MMELEDVLKKRLGCIWLAVALLMLPAVLLANGNGDVTIKVNGVLPNDPGYGGWIMPGMTSIVQIWIKNDAPIYSMSMAFALSIDGLRFRLEPYQYIPPGQPYIYEWGDARNKFDPNGLQVTYDSLTNILLIQGTASSSPLPVHTNSTLCYSFKIHGICGDAPSGQFHVDNIYVAPNGTWMFDDGTPYAPTFEGQPNASVTMPDAPAVSFVASIIAAMPPVFTSTPNSSETVSRCSAFQFTFSAEDGNVPVFPLEFFANVGDMNKTTGQYTLSSDSACPSTQVTAIVTSDACISSEYTFTVNWVDTPPIFTNCPVVDAYIDTGQVYEYPFRAYDPDACDKVTYSVGNLGGGPHGAFAIDSTGKFVFTPTVEDLGYLYVFDVVANSGCIAIDSCRALVMVEWNTCGDANGDMVLDISDVVSLITYIFQGGLPPNPPSNGDVDCSGSVDISDVVYIVTHIFSDGPGPCDGCK